MRPDHHTLRPDQVHRFTADLLQRHLPLTTRSTKLTATLLWSLLLTAAARLTSLSAVCRRLAGACSYEAARSALLATLPDREALTGRLHAALVATLPRAVTRRPRVVAVDLTLIPYYGRHHRRDDELYRSKPKAGTSRSHAYATAVIVEPGRRFTLALTVVDRGEPLTAVLRRVLDQVAAAGVTVRYLLLDSGFYQVAVLRDLQAAGIAFLLPVVRRGRRADHPKGPGGTRRFAAWRRSGWSEHTLNEHARGKARVTVSICVKRLRRRDGKGHKVLVYACWRLSRSHVAWVRRAYRRRFGIEASYRQLHRGRARTSSRRPELRLLYVGLALVVRNVWAYLHWAVLSTPRRGGRLFRWARLRLAGLLDWLARESERRLGVVEAVACERPFPA